jgi:choline dehydrogenase-like flavoprotein
MDSYNGAQRTMRFIASNGIRQDVAPSYLHPRFEDSQHPNLHIVVRLRQQTLFSKYNGVVGIVYRPNLTLPTSEARSVKAKKMVIVASGAFGKAAILEHSRISSPQTFKRAGA